MNVNVKERILLTLTSGKFWAFLAVFVVSVYALFMPGGEVPVKITAAITALGDVVGYFISNVMSKKYRPKENE